MGLLNAVKGLFTSERLIPEGSKDPVVTTIVPKRRAFTGAQQSRLTANWVSSAASADAELKGAIKKLRERSRDLVRNNPHAKNAIRTICANVIGPNGIKLQSQIRKQRGGGKLDQKVNETIEMAWSEWCHADSCHTAGRLSFKEVERLCLSSLIESGEVFIRIVKKPFGKSKVPFALEVLEADQLDDDYTGTSTVKDNKWRMGVELDKWSRPVTYCFLTQHPGDTPFPIQEKMKRHMLLPADEVIHLYITERPGQTRGVPWMATAIKSLHHLDGFSEASLIRARASSALIPLRARPRW
jgi:lambda family phage portal protein